MRVRVDRGAEVVYLELGTAAVARRAEVEGAVLAYDAAGRIVGVEMRGVDPAALHEFAVDLGCGADRSVERSGPSATPRPVAPTATAASLPAPTFYTGPVRWDPEAEAAVTQIPFFRRGPVRLAVIALARKRGLDRVTSDLVAESRGAR